MFFPLRCQAEVKLNEFLIEPSSEQWVEIYNTGYDSVDVSGWIIDDSGGTQKYVISSGTVLDGQSCLSFQSGNFNLNVSSADTLRLLDNNESTVDSYDYQQSPGENVTYGRKPDG